jgi:hypothetical protein
MIQLGMPGRILALGGYWDYGPLIDARLRSLRGGEPYSFFSMKKEYDA